MKKDKKQTRSVLSGARQALFLLVRVGLEPAKGGCEDGAAESREARAANGAKIAARFAALGASYGELVSLAHQQGVTGIAWTGYERLHPFLPPEAQMPPQVKLQWYAAAGRVAQTTTQLTRTAAAFAEALSERGINQLVVLKGIDYAQLYPQPEYREFGDLDCWAAADAQRVDEVARSLGAEVEDAGYKHSHINYHGLTIENHYCFINHDGTRRGRHMERQLASFASEDFTSIRGTHLLSPSPAFTALFLLRHACDHFLAEGIRLRHVTDWLLFLRRHAETARSERVQHALAETRLLPFARLLTAFCERYLGLPVGIFPNKVEEKVFSAFEQDLFSEQPSVFDRRPLRIALRILRRFGRMWRFRTLLDESYWLRVRNTFLFASFLHRHPTA